MRRFAVLLIALQLSLLSCASASDRIRTLLIGQVVPETCPLQLWFDSEPLVDYTMVPTKVYWSMGYDDAKRFIKIYFPRNRAQTEAYDFFMFVNPYFEPFTPNQVENMRSAIVEGGSGAFQTLGGITINWADLNTPWLQSTLAPIFPNDPDAALVWEQNKVGNLPYKVILEEDESLAPVLKAFKPLGIEETPGYWTIVLMVPQEGATVWARAVGAYPGVLDGDPPWLLSWRFGEGMTWSVADDLDCPWWWGIFQPSEQRYGLDILMNIILHSLDRPLPKDVVLVNAVRQSFMSYIDAASRLTSVLDFVEKFGANTNRLMDDREKIDLTLQAAKESYMDGFYEEALVGSRDAIDSLLGLEEDAIDLKRQALAWVYVIEWTSVTGTGMLVGVAVYLLMVRRRLYRQVGVTRLA
jgi:hypothetical protein